MTRSEVPFEAKGFALSVVEGGIAAVAGATSVDEDILRSAVGWVGKLKYVDGVQSSDLIGQK